MKPIILTAVVILTLQQQTVAYTRASLYWDPGYKGPKVDTKDLDELGPVLLTDSRNQISSYILHSGSCLEFHTNEPPSYERDDEWGWTTELESSLLDSSLNDKIASIQSCGNFSKALICPRGTFIKKILWDDKGMLRNGIEIHCYFPKALTPYVILRSHGNGPLTASESCSGFRSVREHTDNRRKAIIGISLHCARESVSGGMYCTEDKALVGMDVEIEKRSGFIKEIKVYCRSVEQVGSKCIPSDRLATLFTCDASSESHNKKCTHVKKLGYGYTNSYTDELQEEKRFYQNFGFELFSVNGIVENFDQKLSPSPTTGYNWAATVDRTYYGEAVILVEAEAPVGCTTQLSEIIAECSFMKIRPYYLQRQDNCSGVLFITDETIPNEIISGNTYVSEIPEKVLAHLGEDWVESNIEKDSDSVIRNNSKTEL